ncbi:MAG: multicopper oxidase domain-containing protein [Trichodesmium sp.]
MADVALRDAYIIGQENFEAWIGGVDEEGNQFDPEGYLKVLPRPDVKVPFIDPYKEWQEEGLTVDEEGKYYSSWGEGVDGSLDVTLEMVEVDQIEVDGFGTIKKGDGIIPWLNNKETPYELFRGYNGMIPGPMLIVERGQDLNIELINNLSEGDPGGRQSNLHTHGLHVSPLGHQDNVLFLLPEGETWEFETTIPEDHTTGLAWYHPHFHGQTNIQVAAGLAGLLQVNPPADTPDIEKWNPQNEEFHFMALSTYGIQQINRQGSLDDPLNQDPDVALPAGSPLEVFGEEDGQPVYELSDSVFIGYNALPGPYDPTQPLGNPAEGLFEYGGGPTVEPVENVIHTVNGQYNPTLEIQAGEWHTFSMINMSVNSHHVVQLVKEEEDGTLTPVEMNVIGTDTDSFTGRVLPEDIDGVEIARQMTELPVGNPGGRTTFEYFFDEPGNYYFLSNGTEEILGDDAPFLTKDGGFKDGHFTWGPQVLTTVEVTGNEIQDIPPAPEAYDFLEEHAEKVIEFGQSADDGEFERERTYIWEANVGGAFAEGNIPSDTMVKTFEGTYKINGKFFGTNPEDGMPALTMPMVGTTEVWNIVNISGFNDPDLPEGVPDIPLLEWHPFHIHQNAFLVQEINGIPIDEFSDTYLPFVESDTVALPPTYEPGTATPENPYGVAQWGADGGIPSEVKIVMEFRDFPGSYVNHCHILFHEDAGMMAVVRVILNTNDTWLGLSNEEGDPDGTSIELIRGSNIQTGINLTPFGTSYTGGVDIAIADVNYLQGVDANNVNDNVTDVVAVETEGDYTVRVFDGKTLFDGQDAGSIEFDGDDGSLGLQITEFNPFPGIDVSGEKAAVATGDIDGDGFAEIVVGVGGASPLIEIYDGENFDLVARIAPCTSITEFDDDINIAVGDANGDNFEDIYVTGAGRLEIFNGIEIDKLVRSGADTTSVPVAVAEATALLSEVARPYGEDYTGEIEITSGYVLQRPEPRDVDDPDFDEVIDAPAAVQTNGANITTLAVDKDQLSEGDEQVKVWTFAGGHHAGHGGSHGDDEHSEGDHDDMEHMEHGEMEMGQIEASQTEMAEMEMEEEEEEESDEELRLDAAFTPESDITEIAGTFADIPGHHRGEPVLFVENEEGSRELFQLRNGNLLAENKIGTTGDDSIDGGNNGDNIYGLEGNDSLNGNLGDDLLEGYRGIDLLNGGAGSDTFHGGKDNDILNGGTESDHLNGQRGDDELTGGAGSDRFIFGINEAFSPNVLGVDVITDFNGAEDLLELKGSTFTAFDSTESIQQNFAVVATDNDAATSEGWIVYSTESGNLYYNVDGSIPGFGGGGQFATLTGVPNLGADDFIWRSN